MGRAEQIAHLKAMLFPEPREKATPPWCCNRCNVGAGLCWGGGLWVSPTLIQHTCYQATEMSCDLKHMTLQPVKWTTKLTLSEKMKTLGGSVSNSTGIFAKEIQFACCVFVFVFINGKPFLSFKRKEINTLPFLYQLRCQVIRDLNTFPRIKQREEAWHASPR